MHVLLSAATQPCASYGWEIVKALGPFVGAFAAVAIAIWGPWLQRWFRGARLQLLLDSVNGHTVDTTDVQKRVVYRLTVTNMRPNVPARNAHVLLRKVERCNASGQFEALRLMYPLQLAWTARASGERPTVMDVAVVDFGFVDQPPPEGAVPAGPNPLFWPAFDAKEYPTWFDGATAPGKRVRYHLQAVCDDFAAKKWDVFEVTWDGTWSENPDEMRQHLGIKIVP